MSNMNRRSFLKKSGMAGLGSVATVGALEQMMLMLVQGLVNKAAAEVAGVLPRNYVQFHFEGGVQRNVFDNILLTSADDMTNGRFQANSSVGTVFSKDSNNNITGIEYKTFTYNGVQVPWMWKFDVATSSGGRRPASDLLNNMAVIRGFTSGIDGHEFNRLRQTFPEPSGISIAGGVSDLSNAPIAAISVNGASWYRSKSGAAPTGVTVNTGTNSIQLLRKAFDYTALKSNVPLTKKSQYEDAITRATEAIKYAVRGAGDNADVLGKNLRNADQIIRSAAEDLTALWDSAMVRYNTVINRSVNPNILYTSGIEGLTDVAIPVTVKANPSKFRMAGTLTASGTIHMPLGADLRAPFTTVNPDEAKVLSLTNLAQSFALVEYVLTRGLSNSVILPIPGNVLKNINYNGINCSVAGGDDVALTGSESVFSGLATINTDEHFSGSYASLLAHTCMFRGWTAAMLELVEVLKRSSVNGKNVFENTVMHITSDFSRSPKSNGMGTDHGYWGNNTSVISGAFTNGPVVSGNILVQNRGPRETDAVTGSYPGTWGACSKVQFGSEKEYVQLKHVTGTVAQLLKLDPNPWPFNNKVFSLDGTTLKAVSFKNVKDDER